MFRVFKEKKSDQDTRQFGFFLMIIQWDSDQSKNCDLVEVTIVLSEGANTLQGESGANRAVDIQICKTSESSELIDPKMLYMYVIYVVMEPITNMIQTRSLQLVTHPQALSKKEKKKKEAKLGTFASVSYSSTHQLPKV